MKAKQYLIGAAVTIIVILALKKFGSSVGLGGVANSI